jgi:hypothetical protein
VLRHAEVPAVLIEGGFMSTPQDARKLHSAAWRERLAESVAMGILEFCKIADQRGRAKLLAQYRAEEAAVMAGTEFDYQPLAGIGRLVRSGVTGAPGWRGLLPAPFGDEMPPFRMEYEPTGWVQLEMWSAAGEDARSTALQGGQSAGRSREWPDPAPLWPDLRGWRALMPLGGADESFSLCNSPPGAPLDSTQF